jgi:adenylylsulfate kinase-like enzyme
MIYYFTGQPGSGKTTIGKMLYDSLEQPKMQIDGDDLSNIFIIKIF